jgi:hypothetical protein
MKLLVVLASFVLNACSVGATYRTWDFASPANLVAGDSTSILKAGTTWVVILRRDGSTDSVVGRIVVGNSVKDGSHYGFLGRRDLSLRLFVTAEAERIPLFSPKSGVVIYPSETDSLHVWLTADLYDAGLWMIGERRHEAWQGIVCEDSFSHECHRKGTFTMSPTP